MLPVRNCQDDHWDEGKMSKIDMPALAGYRRRSLDCCQMGCGTDFVIESGPYSGTVCDRFQANAGYGFGPRFDIDYAAALIKADALCNELGLDVDNTATILSWCYELYERGILTKDDTDGLDLAWGCHESLLELIGKLAHREGFGSLLADGFRVAADKIGKGSEYYALQVKGQGAIDSFRTAIAWGFGHATSTRGARHLDGSSTTEAEDWPPEAAMRIFGFTFGGQDRYEGKAKLVFWFENMKALVDSLGMCYYTSHWAGPDLLGPADYSKLFTAATGLEKSGDDLMLMGRKIHDVEKAFNTLHAGFTRRDDFPPMRMMMEPVKSGIFAGQRIQWSKYDSMLSEYYELHGWDRHSGWQTRDGLRNLELPEVADKLERAGRLH
jgi:aldehyde:ferredoxin oxidoreductase